MTTVTYTSESVSALYNNVEFVNTLKLKLISFDETFETQSLDYTQNGEDRLYFNFFENHNLRYIPEQIAKVKVNGSFIDAGQIGPYYLIKPNGIATFNTGIQVNGINSLLQIATLLGEEYKKGLTVLGGNILITEDQALSVTLTNVSDKLIKLCPNQDVALLYSIS